MKQFNTFKLLSSAAFILMVVTQATSGGDYMYLNDQGWNAKKRDWFYFTTQGSRLLPYDWFLHLEESDSEQLIRSDEVMLKLGFIPFEKSKLNPDGLAIGFARDFDMVDSVFDSKLAGLRSSLSLEFNAKSQNSTQAIAKAYMSKLKSEPEASIANLKASFPVQKSYLGLTCAACHTATIDVGHDTDLLLVDGAPAMVDFTGFLESVKDGLLEVAKGDDKFDRFAKGVLGANDDQIRRKQLLASVRIIAEQLNGLAFRSHPELGHEFGHGRLDAFAILLNEVAGTAIGRTENFRSPDAPVSYPAIWDTPNLDWVQWNGFTHSTLARNTGEVLGVFADLSLGPRGEISTSANIQNLFELEEAVKDLSSPKWPQKHLGVFDSEKVELGLTLYKAHCAKCHDLQPYRIVEYKKPYRNLIGVEMTPLQDIGTDSSAALNLVTRTGFSADPLATKKSPIGDIFLSVVGATLRSEFTRLNIPDEKKFLMTDRRVLLGKPSTAHLASYKGRPLNGVWSTAPYLHNGSVPNLRELLMPPEKRSGTFYVGNLKFDAENVGFVSNKGPFKFNTHTPGNRNTGHLYGTDLSQKDRDALLEFLKTL